MANLKMAKKCIGSALLVVALLFFQSLALTHDHIIDHSHVDVCDVCVQLSATSTGAIDSYGSHWQVSHHNVLNADLPSAVVVSTSFFSPVPRGPPRPHAVT